MNEALCSILCGQERWSYTEDERSIKFNKDGTGALWCRGDMWCCIAAELWWKTIEPTKQNGPLDFKVHSAPKNRSVHLLGDVILEITLSRQLPEFGREFFSKIGTVNNFTDDAFQPKIFTVRLERGNFILPCLIGYPIEDFLDHRYELRLLFDKSPYPPQSEWTDPERGPMGGPYSIWQAWNHKEFVGRRLPDQKTQGRATNDDSPLRMNDCIVS